LPFRKPVVRAFDAMVGIEETKSIRELIAYARERDKLGKMKATREQLVTALMTLGRSRREAERVIENARNRVRNAADNAEDRLQFILSNEKPWAWTHPREAVLEMRRREFDANLDRVPLTDIERALIDKGNVLWIVAVYPALKWVILSRMKMSTHDPELDQIAEPQKATEGR